MNGASTEASRLRVLYVGVKYHYMNPTPMLLPIALSRHADVSYFGPGYCTPQVLSAGMQRFADSIGDFDVLVTTKDFAGNCTAEHLNASLGQFAGHSSTAGLTPEFVGSVRDYLARNRQRVVVSMLDSDVYAISHSMLDSFLAHGGYFIAPREGCFDLDHPQVEHEKYISRKKSHHNFGLYHEFGRATRDRRIDLCNFVAETEFDATDLALRPYDVSVPGSHYARRGEVYRHLKSQQGVALARRRYEYAFQIANKLRLRPFSNIYATSTYQLAFQQLLRKSKTCVTDGGMINFTIRKYFEIPAAGALLVCWATNTSAEYGFEDKVNCLIVDRIEEVSEIVRAVAAAPSKYQHVVNAGQRLVMDRHGLGARAVQLDQCLRRISAGSFNGSSWRDGNFFLH